MDYDLTQLGWRNFEHMASALFDRHLGARVGQFGDGPDGGREATYRGPTKAVGEDSVDWNGYVVLQAKYRVRPQGTQQDQDAIIKEVEKELRAWGSVTSRRRQENAVPDYLIIATNVHLTPSAGGGGLDRLERVLAALAPKAGIRGWIIWHRDKISRMLDHSMDIRRGYAALITPGDVLSKLHDLLEGDAALIEESIRSFTAQTLTHQRHVRLTESGGSGNLTLEEVGVDLPCSALQATDEEMILSALIDIGNLDLRPSAPDQLDPTYLLMGGPGQGKSTVSNILAQLYRVSLLGPHVGLTKQVKEILKDSEAWIVRERLPRPRKRRWPLRVDLAEVPEGEPLLKAITSIVKSRLGYQVDAPALLDFMAQWPWILILDGLDEVASGSARSSLQEQVADFLSQAAGSDCDLFTVITTRPQGYDNEFDAPGIAKVELLPLNKSSGMQYARSFARAHFGDDTDERERALEALEDSRADPNVARLLASPLQVTIMLLLLADHGHAPRDRHVLFDYYYQTIYKREASKKRAVSTYLNDYQGEIHQLHERVGMRLQMLSEQSGHFDSFVTEEELQALVKEQLLEAGHDEDIAKSLAERLVEVASQRLVLLIPRGEQGIGFEVRSLQEYMAARALTNGPDADVLARLGAVAPAAHWRNTWLLAMGRLLRDRQYLQAQLLEVVRTANCDPLAKRIGVSVELAAALAMEGFGVTRPAVRQELLEVILTAFHLPPLPVAIDFALEQLAGERPALKQGIMNEFKEARNATAPSNVVTLRVVLKRIAEGDGTLAIAARDVLSRVTLESPHEIALGNLRSGAGLEQSPDQGASLSSFIEDPTEVVELLGVGETGAFWKVASINSVYTDSSDKRVVLGLATPHPLELEYPSTYDARLAIALSLQSVESPSWGASVILSDAFWRSLRRLPAAGKVAPPKS